MKKIYSALIFIVLLSSNNSFSQISKGGIPMGFEQAYSHNIPNIEMPQINKSQLLIEDSINSFDKSIPYRFGFNHYSSINIKQQGISKSINGLGTLWQLSISCPNAESINLTFDKYNVPRGAKMFIYNEAKTHILGAFDSENVQEDKFLGCDLLPGSTCIVEYFEPLNAEFNGELSIYRITHGYKNLFKYLIKSYGQSGSCNVNINCPIAADWEQQKRSVACIVVNGNESCTGALVNNTANNGIPYFLTANHCLGGGVSTWVFRFNWESPTCTNQNAPTTQSVSGATLKASSAASDFGLLQLNTTPPQSYNVFYSGWSNVGNPVDSSFCIHHPSGDIKKYSVASNQTISASYNGVDAWNVGQWTLAVTEPGSSGSPLFDPNHRIIGQLYGGPSSCSASGSNLTDYYGKFSTSWEGEGTNSTRLRNWLDPQNSGVLEIDGYDTQIPLTSINLKLNKIINPTSSLTSCNNSITPQVEIKNLGSTSINTFTYSVFIDNNLQFTNTGTFTSALAYNQSQTVTLNAISNITEGAHQLKINISLPNGSADQDNSNNELNSAIYVLNSAIGNLPIVEGFENPQSVALDWYKFNPDSNSTWRPNNLAGGFGLSGQSIVTYNFSPDSASIGNLDYLFSKKYSFQNLVKSQITFSYAYGKRTQRADTLSFIYTTDCGSTWNTLWKKGGSNLQTVSGNFNINFLPAAANWKKDSINLDLLANQNEVQFAFLCKSGNGNNIYLDDINLAADFVGLKEINKAQKVFVVYPNPAIGKQININLLQAINGNASIRLLSVLGSEIYVENVSLKNKTSFPIVLPDMAKGIYWVELTVNGERFLEKMVY